MNVAATHWIGSAVLILGTTVSAWSQVPTRVKSSTPDSAALEAATRLVDELFQGEIAAAKTAEAKLTVIKQIRAAAEKSGDDHAVEYRLLGRAIALSAETPHASQLLDLLHDLESRFDGDFVSVKADAVRKLAKSAKQTEDVSVLINLTLETVTGAVEADRYDEARELTKLAASEVKRFKNAGLKKAIDDLTATVTAVEKEFASISVARRSLAANIDDTQAALAVGKFRCFVLKNWAIGLPLLARGSDQTLSELATLDLEDPTPGYQRKAIADGWYEYSKTVTRTAQEQSRRRALHWYRDALPGLTDLPKTIAARRIDELQKLIPIGPLPWGAVVLMTFEKPTWEARNGTIAIADLSGMKNPGRVSGATMVDGKVGKGISFRDRDDYLEFADVPSLNSRSVSVCAWVCPRNLQSINAYIVSKDDWQETNNGYVLRFGRDTANFTIGNGDWVPVHTRPTTKLETDTWYHLAGTYDGQKLRMYLNGQFADEVLPGGSMRASKILLRIGRSAYSPDRGIDGIVDELAIFARGLSAEEVDTLYRMGVSGRPLLK